MTGQDYAVADTTTRIFDRAFWENTFVAVDTLKASIRKGVARCKPAKDFTLDRAT